MSETDQAGDDVRIGLQSWLQQRLPDGGDLVISDINKPTSGFSAQTWLIDLSAAGSGEFVRRVVARIETADPAVYPQQAPPGPGNPAGDVEVALQYEIMTALHRSGAVPLADLIGYEADGTLLGQPFFVMDFVAGDVPKESPPYPMDGFWTEITPQTRSAMLRNGLEVLSQLHSLDHRELGLEWLVAPGTTPGTQAQIAIWKQFGERELAGREHPLLNDAWRLLGEKEPIADPVTIGWGDARPGNIIWRDGVLATITDFEAAAIAPPQQDLGWWLMFDRTMHDVVGAPRLPGDLTREEQCDLYASVSGRDVTDIRWWQIFAAARYCTIVVRVMNRAVARGYMGEDQQVWLTNPASDALAQLLDS